MNCEFYVQSDNEAFYTVINFFGKHKTCQVVFVFLNPSIKFSDGYLQGFFWSGIPVFI